MMGVRVTDDAKCENVRWDDSLFEVGSFSAVAPTSHKADIFKPWKRIYWVCRDTRPLAAYILTACPAASWSVAKRQVQGKRVDVLFDKRLIRDDLNFNAVDQHHIYRDLIRYAVGLPTQYTTPPTITKSNPVAGGSPLAPWLVLDSSVSGVTRDRLVTAGNNSDGYPASARKAIGACLKQLSELGQDSDARPGPERRITTTREGGVLTATIELATPTIGRTSVVATLQYPGNVTELSDGVDGGPTATFVETLGDEVSGSRKIGSATDTAAFDDGYPLLEEVASASNVSEQNTLDDLASGRLTRPVTSYSLTLDGRMQPVFGSYALGDRVLLTAKRGGAQQPSISLRVTGWSVDLSAGEKISLTVAA